MTETKWTPGPWENQGEEAFADIPFIRIGVGDRTICEVLPPVDVDKIDDETLLANVNLIAAAPDLYAVTDWVNSKLQTFWPADMDDLDEVDITLTYREIRALIDARRKARGE